MKTAISETYIKHRRGPHLRAIGAGLYEFPNLLDDHFAKSVVILDIQETIAQFPPWISDGAGEVRTVSHTYVKWWGSSKEVNLEMTVIKNSFIRKRNIIDIIKLVIEFLLLIIQCLSAQKLIYV
jgi:hypothetical protein